MGTLVEGPWGAVFRVFEQCHQLLEQECDRISTMIKIDYGAEGKCRIREQVEAVAKQFGK